MAEESQEIKSSHGKAIQSLMYRTNQQLYVQSWTSIYHINISVSETEIDLCQWMIRVGQQKAMTRFEITVNNPMFLEILENNPT
jgi:hypothetical protein